MGARRLDARIMAKLAKKLGKDTVSVNKLVYARAQRLGISSPAALVLVARDHGIGTARYQAGLDASTQAEIRQAIPAAIAPLARNIAGPSRRAAGRARAARTSPAANLRAAIKYLIQDGQLQMRTAPVLAGRGPFDIAINQATLVLEDRIRGKAQPPRRMVGEDLVNYAFKEDPDITVLLVPGGERDEQRGYTQMLRGIFASFRNKTHHHITATFTREDAIRVCGFIDAMLRVVDGCTKVK